MSNSADLINLIVDLITPIGVTVCKYISKQSLQDTERIVVNCFPKGKATRWGVTGRMNSFLVNINIYTVKLKTGEANSARIAALEKSVLEKLETAITTTRVKYYSLDPDPAQTVNESEKEMLTNIRVNCTIT